MYPAELEDVGVHYIVEKQKYKNSMKPRAPFLRFTRVLDQIPERAHYLHYSLSTGKAVGA